MYSYYANVIMSILQKTINSLSQKEVINYKIYTSRANSEKDRKDIKLFDLIKNKSNYYASESDLFDKIYGKTASRNVYAQLRTRLLNEINNSLVQFYFHETDHHYIYSELSLYKIYLSKNEWEVAYYHLNKAELKALKILDFSMLHNIYMEYINLSNLYDEIDLNTYIKKRDENSARLHGANLLDDLIAKLTYQLKRDQNFAKKDNVLLQALNKTIKIIESTVDVDSNIYFRSKIFTGNCLLILSKKDYLKLEEYTIKVYNDYSRLHLFSKNNHNLKLQMLCYISNALCANQKYDQAIMYLDELKVCMAEFNNLYYDSYVFFYYNSLANNYIVLNPQKAITLLSDACDIKAIKKHPRHLGYIYLSLAGVCFDLKKYKIALTNILKLYNHSVYSIMDDSFKINISIIEIILQTELKKINQVLELIDKVFKENKKIIRTPEYEKDYHFLLLMKKLIQNYTFKVVKDSSNLVSCFLENKYKYPSNSSINYENWLKEKFNS